MQEDKKQKETTKGMTKTKKPSRQQQADRGNNKIDSFRNNSGSIQHYQCTQVCVTYLQ